MSFQYLHKSNKNTPVSDLRAVVAAQFADQSQEINSKTADFLAHKENAADVTLMSALEEYGFEETTSTNGFPSVKVGEGSTSLSRNTIPAINAVLSIVSDKYEILDPNYHQARHDPRIDADGVLTMLIDGEWVVFDYVDGDYRPSRSIVPADAGVPFEKWTRGNERYSNQMRKHVEINRFLKAKAFGTSFLIVLNREEELALYQERIKDRLEMSLPEVWEATVQDYKAAKVKSHFRRGSTAPTTRAVSEQAQAAVDKLNKVKTPYDVHISSGAGRFTILFDPSEDNADSIIRRIQSSDSSVTFEIEKAS